MRCSLQVQESQRHYYGWPTIYLDLSFSAGCAVCNTVLSIYFFMKTPSVFNLFKSSQKLTA